MRQIARGSGQNGSKNGDPQKCRLLGSAFLGPLWMVNRNLDLALHGSKMGSFWSRGPKGVSFWTPLDGKSQPGSAVTLSNLEDSGIKFANFFKFY